MDTQNVELSNISAKARLMVGVSVLLGLLFDYLFYAKVPGISFPIYIILILLGLFLIAHYFNKQIGKNIILPLGALVFFGVMVFVRSSMLLTFLNIVASIFLLVLISRLIFRRTLSLYFVSDYLKVLFVPIKYFLFLLQTFSQLFIFSRSSAGKRVVGPVIKGVLLTFPILLLFLALFASADLVFEKYVSNLINLNINPEIIFRLIIVAFTASIFTGAYAYIFGKPLETSVKIEKQDKYRFLGSIEMSILLGTINALFLIFIFIQITYLFGGEGNIVSQGLTYAEYARRGFFELIVIAVVSLFLLLTTEKIITKNNTTHTVLFKVLSSALIVQVIMIIVSAFKRLLLYENAYGFTVLRLYSHAFIVLLGIIFVFLLLKIVIDKSGNLFAFRSFISIVAFLVIMNLINPDAFIARQNLGRFEKTGKIDVYYLARLSEDALPETINLLDNSSDDIKNNFARVLYWQVKDKGPFTDSWQSKNVSKMRADRILQSKMSEIEKYRDYQGQNQSY